MRLLSLAALLFASAALGNEPVSPSDTATYRVRKGDTLQVISLTQFGTSKRWKEIAELNEIGAPFTIRAKQSLKIPTQGLISKAESDLLLLKHYRRKFGLPMSGPAYEHAVRVLRGQFNRVAVAGTEKAAVESVPAVAEVSAASLDSAKTVEQHHSDVLALAKKNDLAVALEKQVSAETQFEAPKEDRNLIWLTGPAADAVYGRLKNTKRVPASHLGQKGLKGISPRVGVNIACAKYKVSGSRALEVRCLGYSQPLK